MTAKRKSWPMCGEYDTRGLLQRFRALTGRIQMLWHAGFWDGPLSGYVELDGQPGHWVEMVEDFWDSRPDETDDSCTGADGKGGCPEIRADGRCCIEVHDRVYLVYQLDDEQRRVVEANHALFREHVGTHTDYDDQVKVQHESEGPIGYAPGVKPRSGHSAYYDAPRETMAPLREDQVVGYTLDLFAEPKSRRRTA